MSELLSLIIQMSITASYAILVIILLRPFLTKAPKFISYALWTVVGFRLMIPFSFHSKFSLFPRNINTGKVGVNASLSEAITLPATGSGVNSLDMFMVLGTFIWILGITLFLTYFASSIMKLKKQLKEAEHIEGNIYEAKNLKTPFVLGILNPKIYLPIGLKTEEKTYILLHERIHIQRKDPMVKIMAYLILTIHWFNPLVWVAFKLMNQDMEYSCDEKVLKVLNSNDKKSYATTLLSLSTDRQTYTTSLLAFGEGKVKGRIKNVLGYKKPKFSVILLSTILVAILSVGLLFNPEMTGMPVAPEVTEENEALGENEESNESREAGEAEAQKELKQKNLSLQEKHIRTLQEKREGQN